MLLLKKMKIQGRNTFTYTIVKSNTKLKELVGLECGNVPLDENSSMLKNRMIQDTLMRLESAEELCNIYFDVEKNMYFEIQSMGTGESDIMVCISDVTDSYKKENGHKKQIWNLAVTMGKLMEKRDLYTADHQRKVAILATKIAIEMGLPIEQVESIQIAGMLHDIGKISIPSEILTKPDKLTPIEYELMKTHVQNAYDILKGIEFELPIAQIVKQHHEKLNGSGYPSSLRNEEIMLEARILSVADVFEAITSHRPYRPSLGVDFAIHHLQEFYGILYEKQVVDACVKVIKKVSLDTYDMESYLSFFH